MHYEILSPLQSPNAWFAYVLNNGAILIGIYIALRFFQATRRGLWIALVAALLLTPVISSIFALRHGIPLLPWAEVSSPEETQHAIDGTSRVVTVTSRTYISWDYTKYLLAIALASAYSARVRLPPR